jgi:hypothetical protein
MVKIRKYPLPTPDNGVDRSTQIIRWLGRNGMRKAVADFKITGAYPVPDEIADFLETVAHRHARDVYPWLDDFKRLDKIERQIEEAAAYVVEAFNSDTYFEIVERARNGGLAPARKGSRVRVSPHLEWLREHPDMGATEAGRARKITRQQVNRLRAKIVALDAQAEMDLLFSETKPDPLAWMDDLPEMRDLPEEPDPLAWMDDLLPDDPDPQVMGSSHHETAKWLAA